MAGVPTSLPNFMSVIDKSMWWPGHAGLSGQGPLHLRGLCPGKPTMIIPFIWLHPMTGRQPHCSNVHHQLQYNFQHILQNYSKAIDLIAKS